MEKFCLTKRIINKLNVYKLKKEYKKIRKVVKICDLIRHPIAVDIYELNDIAILAESIRHNGILFHPVIDETNLILSGSRMIEAAKLLGWVEMTVDVIIDVSEESKKDIILSANCYRVKTVFEILKEAEYHLITTPKKQGERNDLKPASDSVSESNKGKSRYDIVAEKIDNNLSGSKLRKLIAIQDFERQTPNANLGLLNKINDGDLSVDRANKLVKNYIDNIAEVDNVIPLKAQPIDDTGEHDWKVYHSSSLKMKELKDCKIHMIFTSVPYFSVRKYSKGKQTIPELGLESSYDEYIANMVLFLKEMFRVLKNDGSCFINVGDTYRKNTNNMIMLRLVIAACDQVGFHLVNSIVWHKTSVLPQTTDKRLQPSYEMIYHLVKDPENYKYYPLKIPNDQKNMKIYSFDRRNNYGTMRIGKLTLSKPYKKFSDFIDAQKFEDVITSSNAATESNELHKLDPSIDHPAIFPSSLCVLPILTTTLPGDTILDPFLGSGTTLDTAIMLGRKGIGYEIEERFVTLSEKRLQSAEKKVNLKDIANIQNLVQTDKSIDVTHFANKDADTNAA